jgi:hypothetical protein
LEKIHLPYWIGGNLDDDEYGERERIFFFKSNKEIQ